MPTITTTVTSACVSGTTTTQTTTLATPEAVVSKQENTGAQVKTDATSPIVIYNWPMMGRCGAQFLMLDYAGIKYTHVDEIGDLASHCTSFGGQTGNFAPPVVIDGDMVLSQSYAQCVYLNRKAGLDKGNYCQFKATQLLADIDDWLLNSFKPGISTLTSTEELKRFLEGVDGAPARFANFARAIEFCIQGDFTFGSDPSCVDFYLAHQLDLVYHTCLRKLQDHTNTDLLAPFPKIAGVWKRVREMPSYAVTKSSQQRPIMMTDEWFKEKGYHYYVADGVVENY